MMEHDINEFIGEKCQVTFTRLSDGAKFSFNAYEIEYVDTERTVKTYSRKSIEENILIKLNRINEVW